MPLLELEIDLFPAGTVLALSLCLIAGLFLIDRLAEGRAVSHTRGVIRRTLGRSEAD